MLAVFEASGFLQNKTEVFFHYKEIYSMKTTFKLLLAIALFSMTPFLSGCTGAGSVETEEIDEELEFDEEEAMAEEDLEQGEDY